MSSELLEHLERDEQGASIHLKMNSHGYAWLTVFNGNYGDMQVGGSEDYVLSPDEKGWKSAEMIVGALVDWTNHTKRIKI